MSVITNGSRLQYTYHVKPGATPDYGADYGIHIAQVAAFPTQIIDAARHMSNDLRKRLAQPNETTIQGHPLQRLYAAVKVYHHCITHVCLNIMLVQ
jgi:DNA mismatch repair ATPase MutS